MKKNILNKITLVLTIAFAIIVLTGCGKKFTVTFNSNGGSAVQAVEVKKGQAVEKPVNPTRDGFEFIEWTLDNASYDFSNKVTSDITLVAKWKAKENQNTGEQIDAPKNVKLSNTTLSWDPVDKATGYVVYVNGVAKEVASTSIALSELNGLNNVEDVYCVVAKLGNTESRLSTPYINKVQLNQSEVEEFINKHNVPQEIAEELLCVMKKYNLTYEEIDAAFNDFDTTSPQTILASVMKLLNNKSFKGIVDAMISSSYVYANQMLDTLTSVPVPPITDVEENAIEQLYATIKLSGYEGKNTSKEDKLFTEIILPFLYCNVGAVNLGQIAGSVQAITYSVMFYGYYLNRVGFSATRNGQVITIKVNDQTIETNFTELTQSFSIALSQDMTSYQSTLQTLFNAKVYPFAVKDINLVKEQLNDFYTSLKGIISTQLDILVDGINNIFSATEMMNGLMMAVQDIMAKFETVNDEESFKALVKSVNDFKNQALDAIVEVLPTEKQYNAIAELISALAKLNKNGDEIIKNLSYKNVEDTKKLLQTLKTIDLAKYDFMTVINAIMTQDETAMEKAQALLAQILGDIQNVLPSSQVTKPTLDEQAKEILAYLQSLEKDSFPILSVLNVLFGTEISQENVKNVIKFVNDFVDFAVKYEWNEEAIKAIIGNLVSGTVNPNEVKELGIMVLDMALAYVNSENLNQVMNVVTSVLELVAPVEAQQTIKDVCSIIANNLDAFKSYASLYVRCANSSTNEQILQSIDIMIEFASNETKYNQLRKFARELLQAVNPDFSEADLDKLLPTNIVAKLQEAKPLFNDGVILTPEQETLIEEINNYMFPGWIIPQKIVNPSITPNPEHWGEYYAEDNSYFVVIYEYGIILNGELLEVVNTFVDENEVFYYYGYVGEDYYEVVYLAPFPAWGLPAQVEVNNEEKGIHITCSVLEEPLPAEVQKEHMGTYKGTKNGTEYVIVITENQIMVNGVEFVITAYDSYEGYTGTYNGEEFCITYYEATATEKAKMIFMDSDITFYVQCELM